MTRNLSPAGDADVLAGRVIAVVPLRGGGNGKTRLAEDLAPEQRTRLVGALARHVVTTLVGVVDRVVVVTGDVGYATRAIGRPCARIDAVEQVRSGLNGAVADGVEFAFAGRAERVVVMHADLPLLTTDDVLALLAPSAPVVLAPDRAEEGTNAVVVHRSAAAWRFRFGPGSAAAHRAEAERLGLTPHVLRRPGLGTDLDTPADWARLPDGVRAELLRTAG
ncbi:2-phospho-L-lactate guanylyltransferase [Georgenia alba]|uniref:Phosphoenolpyruvate guanylyltransferase n=1 Tax=Georgenia alba TaxID=2233858 RepID=A0ABW2Q4X5_9MICO